MLFKKVRGFTGKLKTFGSFIGLLALSSSFVVDSRWLRSTTSGGSTFSCANFAVVSSLNLNLFCFAWPFQGYYA